MNQRKFANLFAYVAFAFMALAVLVKYFTTSVFSLSSDIAVWCEKISYYLAMLATFICAFSYARTRRNSLFVGFLIIFLAVIIVFTFFIF